MAETHSIPPVLFPIVPLTKHEIDERTSVLLVNSDTLACNENLSLYVKMIVDNLYNDSSHEKNFHQILKYALRLLNLNMFMKNFRFGVAKLLGMLGTFSDMTLLHIHNQTEPDEKFLKEAAAYKEFVLIALLLVVRLKGGPLVAENADNAHCLAMLEDIDVFLILREMDFIAIISKFISVHIIAWERLDSPYILLKFASDLVFEYLYVTELLSDSEFVSLVASSRLVQSLTDNLLSARNLDAYEIDTFDYFEDEQKLIAYEEFKLLLLINEQFLMKSYVLGKQVDNAVYNGLMRSKNNTRFLNLLVYHLNREKSEIIKILILKFLYLMFTDPECCKLFYLNDLKILVDVFLRECNNVDYTGNIGNRQLMISYLKVMYPLLKNSQIGDKGEGYKKEEIMETLGNFITNSASTTQTERETLSKLATKCMKISWLKAKSTNTSSPVVGSNNSLYKHSSAESSASSLSSVPKGPEHSLIHRSSVRAANKNDYYRQTRIHNMEVEVTNGIQDFKVEKSQTEDCESDSKDETPPCIQRNILELPNEYLSNKPPNVPLRENATGLSLSLLESLISRKAKSKKAPPPPPPPPRRRR